MKDNKQTSFSKLIKSITNVDGKNSKIKNTFSSSTRKKIGIVENSRYYIDWVLISVVFLLLIFGLTFLSSALSSSGLQTYFQEFTKQLFFAGWIGGCICFLLAKIDYHFWIKHYKKFFYLTIIPLLFLVFFIVIQKLFNLSSRQIVSMLGPFPIKPYESKGALRWISISFLPTIQPAEIAKLFLLIYLSGAIQYRMMEKKIQLASEKLNKSFKTVIELNWKDIAKEIGLICVCYFFILIQPDLGSVIISSIILIIAMWNSKFNSKLILKFIFVTIIIGVISILALSYRSARVSTFFDFYADPVKACEGVKGLNSNFQVCQIRQAIISGGTFGKGFGQSEAKKNSAIPEISTDAILAVIGEESGFIGVLVLLIMYLIIFLKGMEISKNAPDIAGKSIASGIAIWVLAQAIINIAGVTGLMPLKGTTLPFVSEGGSAIILNLMSMGLLINISSQRIITENKLNSNLKSVK